jgi:hypothetical protein
MDWTLRATIERTNHILMFMGPVCLIACHGSHVRVTLIFPTISVCCLTELLRLARCFPRLWLFNQHVKRPNKLSLFTKAPTVCETAGSCVDATLPRRASSGQARHHYADEVVFLNRVAITSQDVDARPLLHDWRWHH